MADDITTHAPADADAQAPAGGRQDHAAMRAAAQLPVSGPASTDVQAASGGLTVPGEDPVASRAEEAHMDTVSPTRERIPGEYDATTAMHRQPGAIGTPVGGTDRPTDVSGWTDEYVREEARRIGGDADAGERK
jgi:hypothetical protein